MDVMIIIDAVIILLGVYMIYVSLHMKKVGEISSLLIAKEEMTRCKDKKGFIDDMSPKLILFASIISVVGVIGIAIDLLDYTGGILNYAILIVFLIAFVIYTRQMRSARSKYFY